MYNSVHVQTLGMSLCIPFALGRGFIVRIPNNNGACIHSGAMAATCSARLSDNQTKKDGLGVHRAGPSYGSDREMGCLSESAAAVLPAAALLAGRFLLAGAPRFLVL